MEASQFRIARPTNNLAAISHFYVVGLGLEEIGSFTGHDGYDGVLLGLPGVQHHLEFTQFKSAENCLAPSHDHLLVLYFESPEKYTAAIARLHRLNILPVEPANPYWAHKSQTFEDPEGWRVVLHNGLFR
jgi:hypothetical protein